MHCIYHCLDGFTDGFIAAATHQILFARADDKQALSHGLVDLAHVKKTGLCQQPFSQRPCLASMLPWLVLHA